MRHPALVPIALACVVVLAGCRARLDPATTSTVGAPSADAAAQPGVRVVHAANGEVAPMVRGALTEARANGRALVVYVGATWCEPCQRFHAAALGGALDAAFPQLTLLEFDADRDGERLANAGYYSHYIPLFALPSEDGRSSGQQIEGSVKGDAAVGNLTPRLKELLAR